MIGTKEQQRQLIDACNLLCEFVDDHLPSGWDIELTMGKGEASVKLIDPSGEEVWTDSPDYGVSTLSDMIESAIETEAARIEAA